MTADELRKILETMPYKGGGAEGAMWAVGKILASLEPPKPRFIEGRNVNLFFNGEYWRVLFPIEAVHHCQEMKLAHRKPTTIVHLNDGTRVDIDMPYDKFMEKLNATDPV